jgi:ribosomal protein L37E
MQGKANTVKTTAKSNRCGEPKTFNCRRQPLRPQKDKAA